MKSETDSYGYTTSAVSSPVNQWTYAYEDANWKDKLTKFNGATITYDAIGNPEVDGSWTYTWEKGRQLKSMHNANTGVTMEFKYNHDGIRTQKVKKVNGVVEEITNYILSGKKIVALTNSDETLYFTYDSSGAPAMVIYCGTPFTYVKNLQGDIVGITDANGDIIVKYQYDAWGRLIRTSGIYHTVLGKANPFRYREYVYDEETGLYYLRSRYYNPERGRFVNEDSYIGRISMIGQHNQYSYCANIPVGLFDENGRSFLSGLKHFGEQLAYNFLYSPQIKFWNNVCLGLYVIGCEHSAELLNHSLQPRPTTISYSNNSSLAEKIKNDSEFKEKVATIIENQTFNETQSMAFKSDFDLFGALHKVKMIVSPVTINGEEMYHVYMTDTYDFQYESDYSSQSQSFWNRAMKAGAIAGNNLAYFDMNRGAINEYDIVIDFYIN